MTPVITASDARIDIVDGGVFVALTAMCGLLFFQGGAGGLLGLLLGALVGLRRPLNPVAPIASALKAATAGLWAGAMVGGMIATAL